MLSQHSKSGVSCQDFLWLGRKDSNLRMMDSESIALPLGYSPIIHNSNKKPYISKAQEVTPLDLGNSCVCLDGVNVGCKKPGPQ